jgi:hypothetical protein
MVLIGLLLAALACIVLGVVTASAPWFIGSLVASVLAGYLLWRQRDQIGAAPASGAQRRPVTGAPRQSSLVTGTAFAGKLAGSTAAPELEVWVVDGKPNYHARTCAELSGERAEAVPLAQAAADGFIECPTCRPIASADAAEVWVVDGRPDYHLHKCERLTGLGAEPIPRGQAVADGFRACPDCRPDDPRAPIASAPAPERAGVADPGSTVWVIEGRPRYHLEDCLIIKGQDAAAMSIAQATEDGLMPCSMCEPNVTRI